MVKTDKVWRSSIESCPSAEPANSIERYVAPATPMSPMIWRMMSCRPKNDIGNKGRQKTVGRGKEMCDSLYLGYLRTTHRCWLGSGQRTSRDRSMFSASNTTAEAAIAEHTFKDHISSKIFMVVRQSYGAPQQYSSGIVSAAQVGSAYPGPRNGCIRRVPS